MSDQFTFAYLSVRGDVTITARLASVSNVDPWAQAGLMIRNGTGTGSRHAFVFATPGNGVLVRSRRQGGGSTTQASGGAGAAPVWLKLERRSSMVTASRSANGVSWTVIRTVSVSFGSTALVGLAVASHAAAASVSAAFGNVTVNGQSYTTPNTPPAVSLTSPAGGASYSSPASIAMSATATDSDGTIAKVEFYAGTSLLGTDTTQPYGFTWSGVSAGTYLIKAIATDDQGASTTSATAAITVTAPVGIPPAVSLTSPAQGASFVAPASVTLSATASDPDGTIASVRFYVGTALVGTDTTSPYSVTWSAGVGSYSASAVATDSSGATTVSAWRDFVVTAAPLVSTAVFRPASPSDAVDHYVLEIFASGADPDTAAPIATQNLGLPPIVSGECSADVRATVLGLAAGSYVATVSAIGAGEALRSNTFAFTR